MNPHALSILEFDRVLDLVAGQASSALGAGRVRALAPRDDLPWLEGEHARVSAVAALVSGEGGWRLDAIPDATHALARLRIEGTMLSGKELQGLLVLLRSSRLTSESLRDARRPAMSLALLAALRDRLVSAKGDESAIERVVADDGAVRDDASLLLRKLRRELRGAEGELVALLERIMSRLEPHQQVSDMSVTVRNGRYVIPVRRDGRSTLGGIVHDTSGTGGTIFVEPPAAIEAGNRIRELEADELREVDRILLELTDRIRPLHVGLLDALDALVELDSLYARARFGAEFRCSPARLVPPGGGFRIVDGRHPLLVSQGIEVVPFDLAMSAGEHTLLISGPNTGGKTVLLKTLGLMSALAQAGVPPSVGEGTTIVIYDDIFADVGDEQSIEASLSTFSAHVRNLGEILRAATDRSLVLIDELGSGTDPLEGAALGGAILEELTRRLAQTVATTHLGALKELATEVTGVINASLQFDALRLAPTYHLIKGVPGRSYGLSIARRLKLPEDVLTRAEERVPRVERDVNALLASLETRNRQMAAREKELTASLEHVQARAQRQTERERTIRDRERDLERESRQDARRYLLEARSEVERTIRELKRTSAEQADDVARAARQKVEKLAADQGEGLARLERRVASTQRAGASGEAPEIGDLVEVMTLGGKVGRFLEVRDGNGIVALGAVKMAFPLDALRRSGNQSPAVAVASLDLPDEHVPTEVDLRGMRALEIDEALLQALDSAIRADMKSLRIIHGKGTGALRERVAELLRKDTRVRTFRLGAFNEGGAGVTMADL